VCRLSCAQRCVTVEGEALRLPTLIHDFRPPSAG
jgi:hypothetical protein